MLTLCISQRSYIQLVALFRDCLPSLRNAESESLRLEMTAKIILPPQGGGWLQGSGSVLHGKEVVPSLVVTALHKFVC